MVKKADVNTDGILKSAAVLVSFLLLALCLIGVPFIPITNERVNRLILSPLENKLKVDLDFEKSVIRLIDRAEFSGLRITDRSGVVYECSSAAVSYVLSGILRDDFEVRFDAKGIRVSGDMSLLGSISSMFALPEGENDIFDEISGSLLLRKDTTTFRDVSARAKRMRIKGDGTVTKRAIEGTILLAFAPELIEFIPEDARAIFLSPDEDGWGTISLALSGDFEKPRLTIRADKFILDIKEKILGFFGD